MLPQAGRKSLNQNLMPEVSWASPQCVEMLRSRYSVGDQASLEFSVKVFLGSLTKSLIAISRAYSLASTSMRLARATRYAERHYQTWPLIFLGSSRHGQSSLEPWLSSLFILQILANLIVNITGMETRYLFLAIVVGTGFLISLFVTYTFYLVLNNKSKVLI